MSALREMLDDSYYPGSKQLRSARQAPEIRPEAKPFDGVTPRVYTVRGRDVEFFTIGQLATALERRPVTIRKWERDGVIPKAMFSAPNPTGDPRARRRLYSRAQAEGIVRIAAEEKIIGPDARGISSTEFTRRVRELFLNLMGAK